MYCYQFKLGAVAFKLIWFIKTFFFICHFKDKFLRMPFAINVLSHFGEKKKRKQENKRQRKWKREKETARDYCQNRGGWIYWHALPRRQLCPLPPILPTIHPFAPLRKWLCSHLVWLLLGQAAGGGWKPFSGRWCGRTGHCRNPAFLTSLKKPVLARNQGESSWFNRWRKDGLVVSHALSFTSVVQLMFYNRSKGLYWERLLSIFSFSTCHWTG